MTTTTEGRTEVPSKPALDLALAIHRLSRGMRAAVRPGALNATQVLMLSQLIGVPPIRVGELAGRIQCSQPTATTVANGLAAEGLVERIKDTDDGRAIKVKLTDAGRARLMEFVKQEAEFLDELMADLSVEERELMQAAVPILLRVAQASVATTPQRRGEG